MSSDVIDSIDLTSRIGAETMYINVLEPSGPPSSVLLYYAVLAYPDSNDLKRRRSFFEAMAAMRFKEFAIQMRSRKGIPPYYSGYKKEKMLGGINLGWSRMERRIHAALIGWCVCLSEREYRYPAPTPDGKIGLILRGPNSVKKAIRMYVENRQSGPDAVHLESESAAANAAHRIWAKSFPVLHLAMANPVTLKIMEAQVNKESVTSELIARAFFDSVHDTGWLRKALEDAEDLKLDLRERLGTQPNDRRELGYKPEQAIALLPTEDPRLAYRFPK